jgi:hypothetical protein
MIRSSLSKEEINKLEEGLDVVYFKSRFNLFRIHKNFRPSCIHGIIGTQHSGKSTFAKTIICDIAKEKKILVWLSEETRGEYQVGINRINGGECNNIVFFEEKFLDYSLFKFHSEFLDFFERTILEANVDIILIDNITSSRLYSDDIRPSGQNETASRICAFAKKTNVSVIYLGHTKKDVTDNYHKIIRGEDIRGSAQIVIRSEYLYVLQKFTHETEWAIIVKLEKCRHHDKKGQSYFLLDYGEGIYYRDNLISFEKFNLIYKNREYLGKR